MCRDYLGIRSTGAIIYHPIENKRAIWLCANSTNDKGCFIGYNNIEYKNYTNFRWRNGAQINVFEHPWFGNPFLNVSNDTNNINRMLTNKYGGNESSNEYCTAIVKDINNEWG